MKFQIKNKEEKNTQIIIVVFDMVIIKIINKRTETEDEQEIEQTKIADWT